MQRTTVIHNIPIVKNRLTTATQNSEPKGDKNNPHIVNNVPIKPALIMYFDSFESNPMRARPT